MTKKKRKSTHDEEVLYQKRQKQDASGNDLNPDVDTYSAAKVEPRYNLTYGQRGAIPGLDSMSENGYSDEETHDALAYLRTVRAEAAGIPNLLTAPKSPRDDTQDDEEIDSEIYGDTKGFYSDGAYVAAPTLGPTLPPSTLLFSNTNPGDGESILPYPDLHPQEAYYARLHALFLSQSTKLRTPPSAAALGALSRVHFTSLPRSGKEAWQIWKTALQCGPPAPAQLAAMDKATVLRALSFGTSSLKRRQNIGTRLSAWIWGLLGRLDDIGTLGSEEVGIVRELGKRAVWVGVGWQQDLAEATEEFGEEEMGVDHNADEEDDIEVARLRVLKALEGATTTQDESLEDEDAPLQEMSANNGSTIPPSPQPNPTASAPLQSEPPAAVAAPHIFAPSVSSDEALPSKSVTLPDANTSATLDMIITIVGEFYGQRDLLEFGDGWVLKNI